MIVRRPIKSQSLCEIAVTKKPSLQLLQHDVLKHMHIMEWLNLDCFNFLIYVYIYTHTICVCEMGNTHRDGNTEIS